MEQSCDPAQNGFQTISDYVLGTRRLQLSGELATLGQPGTDIQSLPFGDQISSYLDQYAPRPPTTPPPPLHRQRTGYR